MIIYSYSFLIFYPPQGPVATASAAPPSAPAGGPPPPPPGPPPPSLDISSGGSGGGGSDNRNALFASINKGSDITKGRLSDWAASELLNSDTFTSENMSTVQVLVT